MIVRTRCFTSNLFCAKSLASASSSSSLADGFESRKSSTGSTMPLPIRWNQMRLATDLAKNGFSGDVSHVGERLAAVLARRHVGVADAEELRRHRLAGARLGDLAGRGRGRRPRPRRRRARRRCRRPARASASRGRRTRPCCSSRPASSARTGGCGTSRTACGRRRRAGPSSRRGSAGRGRCGSSWPAGS